MSRREMSRGETATRKMLRMEALTEVALRGSHGLGFGRRVRRSGRDERS
jgi:hypothetical protein